MVEYEIPPDQVEPFTPHNLSEEEWNLLKNIALKQKSGLRGEEAMHLFKNWIDDRLLYHDPIKPMLFYALASNMIKHKRIRIRKEVLDTRIPLLIYIPSGGGKSIPLQAIHDINEKIKSIIKQYIPDNFTYRRIASRRFKIEKKQKVTAEALLGTVYKKADADGETRWFTQLGALGTDSICVINEAAVFFQADNDNMRNVFPYVCEALDTIGSKANEINKQLTGKPPLKYVTETNFILFCQPARANLDLAQITSGTLPRFVVIYSPVSEKFQKDVFSWRMTEDVRTDEEDTIKLARFFIEMLKNDSDFYLTEGAIKQMQIEMEALEEFASRERAAGVYLRTSYQRVGNMIIKMAAINAACRFDNTIRRTDVRNAAMDYRSTFITAMVFFVSQDIKGFRFNDRKYLLLQEIEALWDRVGEILEKDLLMKKLESNPRFNVTEKTINNMLSVLEAGKFLYWDRGSGAKKSYIIRPSVEQQDIREIVLKYEEYRENQTTD